jgi:hypothetical protein
MRFERVSLLMAAQYAWGVADEGTEHSQAEPGNEKRRKQSVPRQSLGTRR